jgi:hypothetical protein
MANKQGEIPIKLSVDSSALDDLPGKAKQIPDTISTKVSVDDTDLKTAGDLAADLNSSVTTTVNVNDAALNETISLLKDIRDLSAIDVSLSLTSAAQNVIETVRGLPAIGQLVSNDNATAILQAFGDFDPAELALAQNLFANNMVESVEAGALLINQFKAMGVESENLDDAANAAVNVAQAFLAVGQEADTQQIALAANQLVINGLADSYTEAADLITAGLGAGLNKNDDFLDTIKEYSSTFGTTGASAEEFFSILNTGLDAGFDNTDRIADLYREGTLRGLNPDETAAQDSLKSLGLADETEAFQAGEITGAEWFKGVLSAIEAEPDAGKQQMFGANILGTQVEDFGLDTVLGIDTIDEAFDNIENRAAEVATLLNDTIGNTFKELINTVNLKVADLLSDKTLDIPGKLQAIKTAFTDTIDAIQSGSSLAEAIEIGFHIPGFVDAVGRFEASIGNFGIGVLEIIAGVQEFLGKDSSASRTEIARLERGQLPFDLKVANADEIAGELKTAIDRGLTTSDIAAATQTAFSELIAGGEIDKAQALVDSLNALSTSGGPMVAPGLTGEQITLANAALREGDLTRIQEQIDAGNLIAPVSIDTTALQTELDAAAEALNPPPAWTQMFSGDNMITNSILASRPDAKMVGAGAGKEGGWWSGFEPPPETVSAISSFGTDTETAMESAALASMTASLDMNDYFVAISDGIITADEQIALSTTGNTMTTSFETVASSAQINFAAAGVAADMLAGDIQDMDIKATGYIAHMVSELKKAQFLSAQVAAGVEAALKLAGNLPAGGGGGGGGDTTINNNVSQTNNNSNNAQTAASTYQIAAAINGV